MEGVGGGEMVKEQRRYAEGKLKEKNGKKEQKGKMKRSMKREDITCHYKYARGFWMNSLQQWLLVMLSLTEEDKAGPVQTPEQNRVLLSRVL